MSKSQKSNKELRAAFMNMGNVQLTEEVIAMLETPFWPIELQVGTSYFRTHDDCDGDKTEGISVEVSHDGDVWVMASSNPPKSLRYRMPAYGGGLSPRTRNALLFLAMAMKLDEEKGPNIEF